MGFRGHAIIFLITAIMIATNIGCVKSTGTLGFSDNPSNSPTPRDPISEYKSFKLAPETILSVASTPPQNTTYTYSMYVGSGTVTSDGVFSASKDPGPNIVKVKSDREDLFYIPVYVVPKFHIETNRPQISTGASSQFIVVSSHAEYHDENISWSAEAGTISNDGLFTAPIFPGTYTITATNSIGMSDSFEIVVVSPLNINSSTKTLYQGESFTFSGSDGVGNYHFEILSGLGQIDPLSGVYTAPLIHGKAMVLVRDQDNQVSTSEITIVEPLKVPYRTISLLTSSAFPLSDIKGGKQPYHFSVPNASHGTFSVIGSLTATYVAPSTTGTYRMIITDSSTPPDRVEVYVVTNGSANLTLSSANLNLLAGEKNVDFTNRISGGSSPFTLTASAGSINGRSYATPNTPGIFLVEVEDSSSPPLKAQTLIYVADKLKISPSNVTMTSGQKTHFTFQSGFVPLNSHLLSGDGELSSGGEYTAPLSTGTTVIEAIDFKGQTVTATITINAPLSISPITLLPFQSHNFSANGGVGKKFFSIATGIGQVTNDGLYTAPGQSGFAIVNVEDESGNLSQSLVQILPKLKVSPNVMAMRARSSFTIVPQGGFPPYTFAVQESEGGMISSQGVYVAPSLAGVYHIRVNDSQNAEYLVEVQITDEDPLPVKAAPPTLPLNPVLTLSPLSFTPQDNFWLKAGTSKNLFAAGGVAPYQFSIQNGAEGTLTSTGTTATFTSSGNIDTADKAKIVLKDSLDHSTSINLNLYYPLQLEPSSASINKSSALLFKVSGGIAPFTWSLPSTAGTITNMGFMIAGTTAGTFTLTATDSLGDQASASIIITANTSSPVVAPSYLVLQHNSRQKSFLVSWTAGSNNGGTNGCMVQYLKDGTIWTDLPSGNVNCDENTTTHSVSLPGDNWISAGSFSAVGVSVRLKRISDSMAVGNFPQKLTCDPTTTGAANPTPSIDENCNSVWDDTLASSCDSNLTSGSVNSVYACSACSGGTFEKVELSLSAGWNFFSDSNCTNQVSTGTLQTPLNDKSTLLSSGTIPSTTKGSSNYFPTSIINSTTCQGYQGNTTVGTLTWIKYEANITAWTNASCRYSYTGYY